MRRLSAYLLGLTLFLVAASAVTFSDAIKSRAPLKKRLVPGLIGFAGLAGFVYLVIRVYVMPYWDAD